MLNLSPKELAYVTLVVGNATCHPDGITAYEKLYQAVIQNADADALFHMHDLEKMYPELNRNWKKNA